MLLAPETSPLLTGRSGSSRQQRASYGSASASVASTPPPRSPFETGFPTLFTSSPIPSPRPHRLPFAYDKRDDYRSLHVFLTLLLSTVGAGMLAVPYTFRLVPAWQAVLTIVLVGAVMATTANALLQTHVHLAAKEEAASHIGSGRKFASFQTIAIVAGGKPFGYVVSIVTAVGIYGSCVGSIRIVGDIAPFLVDAGYKRLSTAGQPVPDDVAGELGGYLLWATFVLVVFPLCLMKNLSGLRVSSYLGFAFSLYLLSAVIYRSFVALHPSDSPVNATTPAPNDPEMDGAPVVVQIIGSPLSRLTQAVSILMYTFMMHLNLVPLFVELRGNFAEPLKKTRRKMTRSIVTITSFCVVLYVAFGATASHLYGDQVRGNILLSLEHDPVMQVPLVAVFLTVVLSFPLLFRPLRGVLEELFFTSNLEEIATSTRLGATTVLLLSQMLVAMCVPGLQVVFGLVGATCCLLLCVVFPVVLYTKMTPWRYERGGKSRVALLWVITVGSTVTGVAAAVFWFAKH